MRTNKWLVPAVLLTSIAGAVGLIAADVAKNGETVEQLQEQLRQMLDDRVVTAEEYFAAAESGYAGGTMAFSDLMHAANDLRDAELGAATTPAEELNALNKHVERMKEIEVQVKSLWEEEQKGGSMLEYGQVQFERKSAQVAVLKARIKRAKIAGPKK